MKRIVYLLSVLLLSSCSIKAQQGNKTTLDEESVEVTQKVHKSEQEWKAQLSPEEYHILRESGTERAFSGKYWNHKEEGLYICKACGHPLFDADTKFKSGTGWPSYYQPASDSSVLLFEDKSYGWNRVEVTCARCESHLGHVFNDGPKPTGLRYCINSASLDFKKQ